MFWSLRFHEPIVLPDGAKLATLGEAVAHLTKAIPKSEHNLPTVVTAAELLTLAAEHAAPIEFARIATLQALNRHQSGNSILTARIHIGDAASWCESMTTVWIYVDPNKLVGDRDHLKVFQNADDAEIWFTENDPEGVAFEYEVEISSPPA